MKNIKFKAKSQQLMNDYLHYLRIGELDLDIIPDLKSQKTGEEFSLQYLQEMYRIGRYFNRFYRFRNELDGYLQILYRFLEQRSKKVSYNTHNIQANALRTLIINQPQILGQDEYFKQILEVVLRDICFDERILNNCQNGAHKAKPEPLNREQLKNLFSNSNQKTRLILSFLIITGCNVRELVRIKMQEVIFSKKCNAVRILISPGNTKSRTVYIPKTMLIHIIEKYHGTNHFEEIPEERYLFQNKKGNIILKNNVYSLVKSSGQKIGFDNLSVSDLNETAKRIMSMNGFSNIQITHRFGNQKTNEEINSELISGLFNCFQFLNEFISLQNNNG